MAISGEFPADDYGSEFRRMLLYLEVDHAILVEGLKNPNKYVCELLLVKNGKAYPQLLKEFPARETREEEQADIEAFFSKLKPPEESESAYQVRRLSDEEIKERIKGIERMLGDYGINPNEWQMSGEEANG